MKSIPSAEKMTTFNDAVAQVQLPALKKADLSKTAKLIQKVAETDKKIAELEIRLKQEEASKEEKHQVNPATLLLSCSKTAKLLERVRITQEKIEALECEARLTCTDATSSC